MSLAASRVRFTELVAKLITEARAIGLNVAFDEGRVFHTRTGRDAAGRKQLFTDLVHKPGSYHYMGLAIDIVLYSPKWEYLGKTEDYAI